MLVYKMVAFSRRIKGVGFLLYVRDDNFMSKRQLEAHASEASMCFRAVKQESKLSSLGGF